MELRRRKVYLGDSGPSSSETYSSNPCWLGLGSTTVGYLGLVGLIRVEWFMG